MTNDDRGGIAPDVRAGIAQPAEHLIQHVPAELSRTTADSCDVCGSTALRWRNCKLICGACGTILRTCADL